MADSNLAEKISQQPDVACLTATCFWPDIQWQSNIKRRAERYKIFIVWSEASLRHFGAQKNVLAEKTKDVKKKPSTLHRINMMPWGHFKNWPNSTTFSFRGIRLPPLKDFTLRRESRASLIIHRCLGEVFLLSSSIQRLKGQSSNAWQMAGYYFTNYWSCFNTCDASFPGMLNINVVKSGSFPAIFQIKTNDTRECGPKGAMHATWEESQKCMKTPGSRKC